MDLDSYVDGIVRQMAVSAAAGGPQAASLAEVLILPLQSAVRLALLEALSAAADELTLELAPGSVEVRLRGGQPVFVIEGVTAAPAAQDVAGAGQPAHELASEPEDGATTRINLRMPDSLKTRVEAAALSEGRSVNAWLVRAATAALTPTRTNPVGPPAANNPTRRSSKRVTGWAQ